MCARCQRDACEHHDDAEPLAAAEPGEAFDREVAVGESPELGDDAEDAVDDEEGGGDHAGRAGLLPDDPEDEGEHDSLGEGLVELAGVACGDERGEVCGDAAGRADASVLELVEQSQVGAVVGIAGEPDTREQGFHRDFLIGRQGRGVTPGDAGRAFAAEPVEPFLRESHRPPGGGRSGRRDDLAEEFPVHEVRKAAQQQAGRCDEGGEVHDVQRGDEGGRAAGRRFEVSGFQAGGC